MCDQPVFGFIPPGELAIALWLPQDLLRPSTPALAMERRADREALKAAFRCFDNDDSGVIDLVEFQSALEMLDMSISKKRATQLFVDADTDHSGTIDFKEVRYS